MPEKSVNYSRKPINLNKNNGFAEKTIIFVT